MFLKTAWKGPSSNTYAYATMSQIMEQTKKDKPLKDEIDKFYKD